MECQFTWLVGRIIINVEYRFILKFIFVDDNKETSEHFLNSTLDEDNNLIFYKVYY